MRLTPPTIPVFLIAVAVAAVNVVDIYTHVPFVHHVLASHRFGVLVAAFVILAAGVVFPGL